MGFSHFGLKIGIRLLIIFFAFGLMCWLLLLQNYPIVTLLSALTALALSAELFTFVVRTNRELTRFLDAARYADFGQRFEFTGLGAGFTELGETFTHILDRFRLDRAQQESELRQLKAMLEHAPIPLLSVDTQENIVLWNNAARRLFGNHPPSKLNDMDNYGVAVSERFRNLLVGERALITLDIDGHKQTFSTSNSEILQASNNQRLISLQNIQSALDVAQLQAWQDLVRVLTHEIMNSITPVSSLSQTAVELVDDVRAKVSNQPDLVDELDDVKSAVDTVARRSEGLMSFVSSYRQLTHLPPPNKTLVPIAALFADVCRIATSDWPEYLAQPEWKVSPTELDVLADKQMIEQVLLNLLQNSRLALTQDKGRVDDGLITLSARLNARGRVTMDIADNGPGIDGDIVDRIFVPFYTTRKDGSGVGLALSRQVMIAHGGNISYAPAPNGGAVLSLNF
jgi:nitrogen fixation/metabolism regulation signal transduction histidine kinase